MREKTIIIAEAGVNHNGDIKNAKKLIDVASYAGVDYVKFQTFKAEKLVSKSAKRAEYQNKNIEDGNDSQFDLLKNLELTHNDHLTLIEYAKKKGVNFFSTAFDVDGIYYLESLGLKMMKIPSGELTNYPYLRAIARTKLPIIMSTGMADLEEILKAKEVLIKYGTKEDNITILHCNTEYPTPMNDVNLKAMLTIGQVSNCRVGYSDHTLGIEVPIAAVSLGASVIEKHFTLNRNLKGPDHKASLEPEELKNMVIAIRNIEEAISGDGIKKPSNSEKKNITIARKSIHLKKSIKAGERITENHLIPLRPGNGISPMKWNECVGKKAIRDIPEGTMIKPEDLK